MNPPNTRLTSGPLPVTRRLTFVYALSLVVAILVAAASVAGLLYQAACYPTNELRQTFVANDVINLCIGLPILLGSLGLARRGKLIGLMFWPGALFYVTYNYITYAVAMRFTWPFALYLALVGLSVYTLISLVASMDGAAIQQQLAGAVPERWAGGTLAGLGLLFFLRAIGVVVNALIRQTPIAAAELAVLFADLLTTPAWVIGGVMLWRRKAFGYVTGTGLLFQASMLFIGLLAFFVLQPFLTTAPFPLGDFIVVLIMGLVCFIPFGLFVRGVVSRRLL